MARLHEQAIGGYLELDFGPRGPELYPHARAFQSGSAAFRALLATGRPGRVWLPWYICESMIDQANEAGIGLGRYSLTEDFRIAGPVDLRRGEWLVYVNYFGLCDEQVNAALRDLPVDQVIIDNSLAFFSTPRDCLATVYSPRKFVGVPDGGYLITKIPVQMPTAQDDHSITRCMPLLRRAGDSPEKGFASWQADQSAVSRQAPLCMSKLTHLLLQSVSYNDVAARRRMNFDLLDRHLGPLNQLRLPRSDKAVPLCYPFAATKPGLRQWLIGHRVFVPQFWPHLVADDSHLTAFERYLLNDCVPLPCDQRYAADEMATVSRLVMEYING